MVEYSSMDIVHSTILLHGLKDRTWSAGDIIDKGRFVISFQSVMERIVSALLF